MATQRRTYRDSRWRCQTLARFNIILAFEMAGSQSPAHRLPFRSVWMRRE